MIQSDGVSLPQMPTKFLVYIMDLDDGETSTRGTDGVLNRDVIRTGVRKIEMEFGLMNGADASSLLKMLSGKEINITYPDPYENTTLTKKFYPGNRSAGFQVRYRNDIYWSGIKATLTEV